MKHGALLLVPLALTITACVETTSSGCSDDDDCARGVCLAGRCTVCGDGREEGPEECDQGEANGTPTATCTAACGAAACGDGVLSAGESCDDGERNVSAGAGCPASDCVQRCGDGVRTNDEACDEGERNGQGTVPCTRACVVGTCGDGVLDRGEGCDEGLLNHDAFGACTNSCTRPNCGDGVRQAGECCDGESGCDPSTCRWFGCAACGVAAAYNSSFVLRSDGKLIGFGSNQESQSFNDGTFPDLAFALGQPAEDRLVPTPRELFPGLLLAYVDQGWRAGAGITLDGGHLVAWGHDGNGLLARGQTSFGDPEPRLGYELLDDAHSYRWLQVGDNTALALRTDGQLVGWGSNGNGLLPGEIPPELVEDRLCLWSPCVPNLVTLFEGTELEGARWLEISLGGFHALAIRSDGTVWGWGRGDEGQLGPVEGMLPFECPPPSLGDLHGSGPYWPRVADPVPPHRIEGGWERAVRVIAGRFGSFVIDAKGQVWSFGANCHLELGRGGGELDGSPVPRRLGLVLDVPSQGFVREPVIAREVMIGPAHTLVLDVRGFAVGFGWNGEQQIIDGYDETPFLSPMTIEPIAGARFMALAVGANHNLGVDRGGQVWAVGADRFGQRGDGTAGAGSAEWSPVNVCGLP